MFCSKGSLCMLMKKFGDIIGKIWTSIFRNINAIKSQVPLLNFTDENKLCLELMREKHHKEKKMAELIRKERWKMSGSAMLIIFWLVEEKLRSPMIRSGSLELLIIVIKLHELVARVVGIKIRTNIKYWCEVIIGK